MKLNKKLLWTPLIILFLVSMTMIGVTSASSDTYFYVDPPSIDETPTGKIEVDINIASASPSFAWEIYLRWDPKRLELLDLTEGDFLHRWYPPMPFPAALYWTVLGHVELDEANMEGEILITCTLVNSTSPQQYFADSNYPPEWASGDGTLVTLEFLVQRAGGIHLELFNTRLWDDTDPETGYPVPTDYQNNDCEILGTNNFYASLTAWGIKVNGQAGGKTTVGTSNSLQAYVSNTGTFPVYAKAFFEIRTSSGYWVDTIPSNEPLLSAGESTTLSATWAAPGTDVYYITAYLFYGETTPDVPYGFSRTLRLRVTAN